MTHQMLVEPGETVVLLPAATRYEQEGGGTSTTTERRVAFSPEIPGPRVGEARSEWQIFADVARRVRPELAAEFGCESGRRDPRRDRARRAELRGHRDTCATTGRRDPGRRRAPVRGRRVPDAPTARPTSAWSRPQPRDVPEGRFVLSTRRGKQFNSMVWADVDPLTGAARDALFVADADADGARSSREGDAVLVRSAARRDARARARRARSGPGNVQAFFPEANPLLAPTRPRAASRACPTTTRSSKWSPSDDVTPDALLELLRRRRATAVRDAVAADRRARRCRDRTDVPGQYALDLVADAAALRGARAGAGAHRERGVGRARARRRRRSPSCSIRSTDRPTARAASRTGRSRSARSTPTVRSPRSSSTRRPASARPRSAGGGAFRDGVGLHASTVTRVEESGDRALGASRPARCRGSSSARSAASRSSCAMSRPAGSTAMLDGVPYLAPWDYLGGYLACVEAGAIVRDANGDELVTDDPDARRQLDRGRNRGARRRARCPRPHDVSLDLDALLAAAERAARAGGEIVRAHFGVAAARCARRRPATG